MQLNKFFLQENILQVASLDATFLMLMPNKRNTDQYQQISQAVNEASAVYLFDYRGIQANQFNLLRREIVKQGGQIKVVKNTLLKRALTLSSTSIHLDDELLTQSTAALFATEDPITPLKAIIKFTKENEKGAIKTGIYQGQVLSQAKIDQLANLPSREVLVGQLVGLMISPLQRLANALNGNTQKLVIALSEIQKQKNN